MVLDVGVASALLRPSSFVDDAVLLDRWGLAERSGTVGRPVYSLDSLEETAVVVKVERQGLFAPLRATLRDAQTALCDLGRHNVSNRGRKERKKGRSEQSCLKEIEDGDRGRNKMSRGDG